MKKMFRSQVGRFIAALVALLLVACIGIGVEKLPFLKADITQLQVMTPDAQVKELISAVDKAVEICYLASDSGAELWIEELASKYADMNSLITYRRISPAANEARSIALKAGAVPAENLLVITSGDRALALPGEEMYAVHYNEMYYYYYNEKIVESQQFVADEQLVNGILYVTADDLPTVYALTGHGETTVSGMLLAQLQDFNVRTASLNLSANEIPEDAAAIIIHTPLSDLTDEETKKMFSYLKNGGKLLLMTNYLTGDLPNLETITAYYGMNPVKGVVLESDTNYCYNAELPYYLIPNAQTHEVNAVLNETSARALFSMCGAIERSSIKRAGLNVTALQTSSDTSYLKADPSAITTYEKEENDLAGPLNVAMAASEGDTRVVWYSSGTFLSDTDLTASGGMNTEILKGTLSWMTTLKDRVLIEGKELMTDALILPTGQKALICAAMFVPAVIALLAGLIRKRRKTEE